MDLRGFTDLGADIGKRVSDSINTGNFDQLSRDIRRKIEEAFTMPVNDLYRDGLDGRLYREEEGPNKGFERIYPEQGSSSNDQMPFRSNPAVPLGKRPPSKGGSIAMMIIGYFIAAVFGTACTALAFLMIPAGLHSAAALTVTGASAALMVPFTAAGLVLGIAGTKRCGLTKRFNEYLRLLQDSGFCQIKQLAARTGKREKFIVKELNKLIDKGYFPEGHIDDHKTCFIGDDDTYSQYLAARDSAARAAAEQERQPDVQDELQQTINEGKTYIKTIREANDAIYDPVISEKLYRMEIIVQKIFEHVRENPEQIGQLRRFMSYYLPTTEKLVRAYQQMDSETVLGTNMKKAKNEIAETLDTINEAYEKLYDSMHIDIAMDVSSDISVLKTMFAQEGLSQDELGGKKDE